MRTKFTFDLPEGKIILPVNYNYQVQSMIYRNLSEKLSDFLHNRGFEYEKRRFKMFTFSRLFGKHYIIKSNNNHSNIVFNNTVSFFLSSPYEDILQEFANSMIKGDSIYLGGNYITISSVEVMFPPLLNNEPTRIKMISPMCIRSTVFLKNGTKKNYYYIPDEKEFSELMINNLFKKFISFYNHHPHETSFSIKIVYFSMKKNYHPIIYKGSYIKAYSGIYDLSGSEKLKQFAYDTGFGERNCQGFGMFEIYNEKDHGDKRTGARN